MAPNEYKTGPYREITWEAVVLGIVVGIVLNMAISYAGMLIGFTIVGSDIAAIIGWGVLRGILRRSTIVENNIAQTIASAINITGAGVIFTIPVLYLRGADIDFVHLVLATMCGASLGVAFIIPLRKQMIDIDRLRFPNGTAVGAILRSPGAGVEKAILLAGGVAFSAVVSICVHSGLIPETVDIGSALGMPAYVENVWAISLLSFGAGFIAGWAGLAVLIGGILAYWIITPLAFNLGWTPAGITGADVAAWTHGQMNRPLGIGMLIGGALMGIVLAFPSIAEAFRSLRRTRRDSSGPSEEMSIKLLYVAAVASIVVLVVSGYTAARPLGLPRIIMIALAGTLWLWLAGIIVAQCTGMTDWSPISGMALIAVTIILFFSYDVNHDSGVLLAVLIGATICVAISQAADLMQDLKTGTLVGAIPARQQVVQLAVSWIGPIVTVVVIHVIWKAYGFGAGTSIPAPQAQALDAAISGVVGGNVPLGKYGAGALIGAVLSGSTFTGLGVMVGLSMYLPLVYLLPFGLGGVLNIMAARLRGKRWVENKGVPLAAGFIVGDAIVGVIFAMVAVLSGI